LEIQKEKIQNTREKTNPGGPGMGCDNEIRKKMGSDEKGKGMAKVLGKGDLHNRAYEDPGQNG